MGIDSESGHQADGEGESALEKYAAAWKVRLSHKTEELYADDQEELLVRPCTAWEAQIPLTHR